MSENSEVVGKKIFFLYPQAVVQNRITEEFIQQELEVYIVKDHVKLRRALKKFPDSIVFVNIYDKLPEKEWEAWIRGVMSEPATAGVKIGIISQNEDPVIKQKYLNQIKIQCGFTVIKSDLNIAMKQLFDILMAADAKGRRKYIRAVTEDEPNAMVNIPRNGIFINGQIKDISVVGFSCFFNGGDPELPAKTLFQDIQLKLQTTILKAEGIVFGSRLEGSNKIYVILFTQRVDPDTRARIRRYIQSSLQSKIDSQL